MSEQESTPTNVPPADARKRSFSTKVGLAVAGAGLIVFGALAAPLVWQTVNVSADSTRAAVAAPALQIDSTLDEDQAALAALYEAISPSVVNIQVESTASTADLPQIPGFQMPQTPQGDMPLQRGEGSGFIYDNEGHIVTNNHVVEGAQKVIVNFNNGMWARAEVVAADPQADLAVIKVTPPEGMEWQPLALADNGGVKVGHMVIAIGNPFGLQNTMTTGIVSALGRGFPVGSFGSNRYTLPDVIQTDAAINPGNSGGPLLNLDGEVVGVNFAIESQTRQNSGVGFAIPSSIVERVVPALIADGAYKYAYLGLEGSTISPQLAEALNLPDNTLGVYVSGVVPGGPSETAGVKGGSTVQTLDDGSEIRTGGDIVTAIDDVAVVRFEDLVSYLVTKAEPGKAVTLTVERDGKPVAVEVTLGERPQQPVASFEVGADGKINARAAIAIAEQAVASEFNGTVTEKVATPEDRDGKSVWVVELSTDTQSATVVVDAQSGEVIEMAIK